ncbi:MAG: hypothetical protein MJ097_07670 [Dorea sp.]|nr:hypothetical protein [Dorea sp.]
MKADVTKQSSVLCKTITVYGRAAGIARYALAYVANALAEADKQPMVSVRIEMPEYTFKSRLHAIQKELKETAKEQNIVLTEVLANKHPGVALCAVTVTGIALTSFVSEGQSLGSTHTTQTITADFPSDRHNSANGQTTCRDVVMLGYSGMEGMLRIMDEKEEELKKRFSYSFIKQIKSYAPYVFMQDAVKKAMEHGACKVVECGEGGVLATIWNLALEMESGIDLDFKKIQVLQETVEVCEQYRLNPYQLASAGTFFFLTEDGELLAEALRQENLPAVMVGRLTDNNDKILRNGEEVRYVDRPATDEIYKIFEGYL